MIKETGEALLDSDGNPVISSTTFIPEDSSGSVDVVFTIDATTLGGKHIVAYETLEYNNVVLVIHADLNDDNQTVRVPEIGTTLTDDETRDHVGRVDGTIRLTDTVAYTGLVVGKTYTVTGILVNKDTGMWIIGSDGEPISASTEFTAERSSGFVDVEFDVNSVVLEGTTIVAFETVTYLDQPVAIHADIEDEGQTVHLPSITTTATVGGSKTFLPADSITLTDTITYSNLVPGRTYELQGRLMTSAGVEFAPNGTPAVSVFRFVPETADGSVDVTFVFYGKDLKNGDKLVVFEKLYLIEEDVDANGNVTERSILIATHEDLTDDGQTVTVTKPGIPSTGETSSASFVIGIVCVIIGGVVAVIYLKKRKDQ